jgi:chromosome segregation ATPase
LKAQVENLGSELATTTDKNSELKTQIKEQQAKIRKIEESVSAALAGAKEAGLVANASSEAVADADDDIKTLETGINGLISALEKATEEIKDVGEETEKAGDSIREAFTPLISGEGGEGGLKPEVQGEEVNASGESKHGKAIGALNKVAKKTQEKVGAAETLGEKVRAEVKGLQKVIGIIGAKQKRTKAKLREAIAEANEAIQAAMAETTKANERITAEKIRNANLEARLRELEAENERLRQGLRDIGTMKPSEPAGDQAEISSTAKAVLGELKERRESAKLEIGTLLETLKSSNSDEESNVLTQLFSKLKMWFKTLGTNERGQVLVFLKDEGLPQGKKNAFLESLVESLNGEVKPEDITFADAVRKAIEGDERFDQNLKGQLGARIEALRQAAAAES